MTRKDLRSNVRITISVTMVVEFHKEAGKIHCIFTPKWKSWKDLFISCKTVWCRAGKKYGTFLLNEVLQKWFKKRLLIKVVPLNWYSSMNFRFRKIALYFPLKIDFEIWKCLIFDVTASSCLTKYQQICSVCSFGCKNVFNFTSLPMNFYDRDYANYHGLKFDKNERMTLILF